VLERTWEGKDWLRCGVSVGHHTQSSMVTTLKTMATVLQKYRG
jgi:hypothetical protein